MESFPQFPYGSPAELTRSKQIPGAGLAPGYKDKQGKYTITVAKIKSLFPHKNEDQFMRQSLTTCSPQGDALLLMSLADAVVAVAFDIVAGVPVMKINVGWAVRVGTRAELWQVTRVTGLPTQGASRFQL